MARKVKSGMAYHILASLSETLKYARGGKAAVINCRGPLTGRPHRSITGGRCM